ncbi:hypothetical protein N8938_05295 [Candidatus Pelagibacter sp.]|nr:hypothetical protein [Candidatus Pelagibacter sp.]
MTKKINSIGFIYCAQDLITLKKIFSNDYYHISNISQHFKKIYIVNLTNLYLFKKKINKTEKIFDKYKFKKNIIFINLNNLKEFKKFFTTKSFLAILCMRRTISELFIYFHLKKMDVKFFQISNIGNVQYGDKPVNSSLLRSYFAIYWKKFNHKLFIFLNKFGITPKIEIRFLSNSAWIKSSNNKKIIKKNFLRLFRFSYAKELMPINSRAYDLFKEQKLTVNKKYIVLLDELFDDPQYVEIRGYTDKKKLKIHYENLIEKLKNISNRLKKKVIVCIHPSDNLKKKKKIFSKFLVKQFETKKYIYQSDLVLFFESSAIIDAVMLKKKIMTIDSKAMDENQISHNLHYVKEIDIPMLNIDQKLSFKKKESLFKFDKKKIELTYKKYIEKYIAPDNSNVLGHQKFAKIIKDRYMK